MEHQKYLLCVNDNKSDINKICNDYCYNNAKFDTIFTVCTACLIVYQKENFDKLSNEIKQNNSNVLCLIGYTCSLCNDTVNMLKHYTKAVELNNIDAMVNLGIYYHYIAKNYDQMMKYYNLAIIFNNPCAMCNLGNYYKKIKNHELMQKYYLMAIEHNEINALHFLLEHISIIKIFSLVHNKQFVINHSDVYNELKLQKFLKKTSFQICQICYQENYCQTKDDIYVCALCCEFTDDEKKWSLFD